MALPIGGAIVSTATLRASGRYDSKLDQYPAAQRGSDPFAASNRPQGHMAASASFLHGAVLAPAAPPLAADCGCTGGAPPPSRDSCDKRASTGHPHAEGAAGVVGTPSPNLNICPT